MTVQNGILIGIDLGTTALKAAAFDARSGAAVASASHRIAVRIGADGTREQDASGLRSALATVASEIRAPLGDRWSEVSGLGLCAQGGSGMIVDRDSGAAITPMMLWNDSRCQCEWNNVAARKPPEYWTRFSLRRGPGVGLVRMAWLRKREPSLFTDSTMYVGAGEYAYFLLTGVWRQDACNALQIGCYNVPENRLDAEPLATVGVPLSFVAPLRDGHQAHSLSDSGRELLGIVKMGSSDDRKASAAQAVPVVGPYMDHEAGYLSAAQISSRPLQCSLGTAWVGNFIVESVYVGASPTQLVIGSPLGSGHEVIQPLMTGNVSWDWGLETLVDSNHSAALGALDSIFSERLLPPEGLTALPWLTQANTLVPDATGAGAFFGVSAHTTRHDMLRALAAAIVYEFYRVFRSVKENGLVDSVVLGGGASKGRVFRELLAALFAPLPVFSLADEDVAGARGAVFALSPETAQSTPCLVPVPTDQLCARIRKDYDRYLDLFERICGDAPIGGAYDVTTTANSSERPRRGGQ